MPCVSTNFSCQISHFFFSIGFAVLCGCPIIIIIFFFVVLMHLYHLALFRSLFATHHPQVAFLVIITIVSRLCHLAAVVLSLAGLAHLTVLVVFKVSKARFMFEESTYWFVKTRAIRWSTVVKATPSCGGDPFLHRHVPRVARFDDIKILDLDVSFSCFFLV